jgi:hypothetical protein
MNLGALKVAPRARARVGRAEPTTDGLAACACAAAQDWRGCGSKGGQRWRVGMGTPANLHRHGHHLRADRHRRSLVLTAVGSAPSSVLPVVIA